MATRKRARRANHSAEHMVGPHPGTVIPQRDLAAGRSQDVSTPYKLRQARSLVAHALSAGSYEPGYGLVIDPHRAKQLVKIDQARTDRLLALGESPQMIAYALARHVANLSLTTRRWVLPIAERLRKNGLR